MPTINHTISLWLFMVLFVLNGQAQSNKALYFGPSAEYSINKFIVNDPGISGDYSVDISSGFGFGLSIQKELSQRISIKTGFQYTRQGFVVDYDFRARHSSDPLIIDRIEFYFSRIQIPVDIAFTAWTKDKFRLWPHTGTRLSYILQGQETTLMASRDPRETDIFTRDLNALQVHWSVGFGFDYWVNKHFALFMNPKFNLALNSINSTRMYYGQRTAACEFGLIYKL